MQTFQEQLNARYPRRDSLQAGQMALRFETHPTSSSYSYDMLHQIFCICFERSKPNIISSNLSLFESRSWLGFLSLKI